MRIISKWQDYYDSAVGYGIDKTICYVREKEEITLPYIGSWNSKQEFNIINLSDVNEWILNSFILGFCGKLYPLVRAEKKVWNDAIGSYDGEEYRFFYSYEDYKNWKSDKKSDMSRFNSITVKEFFESGKVTDEPFLKYKTPVFVVRNGLILEKNPCLKDYGFYKVKDSYSTFQDISTYLSNQLVERKEPLEIEDKYRIAQHGFDKLSFRNPIK